MGHFSEFYENRPELVGGLLIHRLVDPRACSSSK